MRTRCDTTRSRVRRSNPTARQVWDNKSSGATPSTCSQAPDSTTRTNASIASATNRSAAPSVSTSRPIDAVAASADQSVIAATADVGTNPDEVVADPNDGSRGGGWSKELIDMTRTYVLPVTSRGSIL